MNNQLLLDNLRCIPDWPIKGVNFRDVSTLFKNPASLKEICDEMYEIYKDKGITKIVGIESRGFVMSSALAIRLGAGVVLCRKPGKLPCKTVQASYAKEYGIDTIEIHEDAINENDVILLHDDLRHRRNHESGMRSGEEIPPEEGVCQLHYRARKREFRRQKNLR